ncbi:MAG: tetratricopeptide repeat protein [Pedobacter sp.]|nr:MAG: tetratricopeptide repeat protein [Pedobacter sp.]
MKPVIIWSLIFKAIYKSNPCFLRYLSLTILVYLLLGCFSANAQHTKLLDSAKNIFRSQPDKALIILGQIKRDAAKTNDYKSIVEAQVVHGNIVYFKGKHDEALKLYLNGLAIAEKYNLHELIASCCNEIGTLFKKNKDLKKALEYYERALVEANTISNDAQIANSYNNIGLVYEEEGNYKKALSQYQKSLLYYQKANEKLGQSYSLEYIGYVYGLMKNYEPAVENLKKSLALRKEIKDNYGIAICLIELTEISRDQKDFVSAIAYAKEAITFCKQINYPDMLQSGYLLLAQIYEQKKDFTSAYAAHKEYVIVKDSIFNDTKSKQINELQTKYDTEKKEQQITILNKENKIQKLVLFKRNIFLSITIGAIVILCAVGFLWQKSVKLKQAARLQAEVLIQQDLATKAILNAEENERKRISGELHDGLGQMFSAVKMNLSALTDDLNFKSEQSQNMFDKTLDLVDESCKEVRSIAHQMAPNVLLKSGLATAIRDFISKIDARKLKINLETVGLNERLDQNVETVLYRVIQETVNNVIKHAEANSLDIQLTKDEDGINAMIEDNGKGFDASQLEKFEGIGLKNIRSRVEYLKGNVDFSSTPGAGTLVAIHIPL